MAAFKAPGQHVYNGVVMTAAYPPHILDRVPDFEFRPDDVLIATYPKTGTTWLQQIASLIVNGDDIQACNNVPLDDRASFIERNAQPPIIDQLPHMKSPRVIKTHLYYSFYKENIEGTAKPKFKTIVGIRNIRDTLVSYYHFYRMLARVRFAGDFAAFFELFKAKKLFMGDYLDHLQSWLEGKDNPNIIFVKYEDMKKDLRGEITKIASFLGKTHTDTKLDAITKACTFKSMEANPMTNYETKPIYDMSICKFMRKGEIGDWQNHLSEEHVEYLNRRCEKQLAPHGLDFEYL